MLYHHRQRRGGARVARGAAATMVGHGLKRLVDARGQEMAHCHRTVSRAGQVGGNAGRSVGRPRGQAATRSIGRDRTFSRSRQSLARCRPTLGRLRPHSATSGTTPNFDRIGADFGPSLAQSGQKLVNSVQATQFDPSSSNFNKTWPFLGAKSTMCLKHVSLPLPKP